MLDSTGLLDEVVKTASALLVSVCTLGFGWFIGQRLTYKWNIRQKRKEVQISVSQQFYDAYGEFFAVWKLWNRLDREDPHCDERRWELHKRAAKAEAGVEGILVKLSSEICLDSAQIQTLGCFRQGFQQLRHSIRTGTHLAWTRSDHPEYSAFKILAAHVAALLTSDWKDGLPKAKTAAEQLLKITSNEWEKRWFQWAGSRPSQ